MANDFLFPCEECTGKGFRYHRLGSHVCSLCKGTGKSERQLLLDIQATQAQILELLQRPAPSQVPGRRDVVYGPSPRDQVIGPGLRQQPKHPPFPNLTEADKAAIQKHSDELTAALEKGK